jgi:hypothetical protein
MKQATANLRNHEKIHFQGPSEEEWRKVLVLYNFYLHPVPSNLLDSPSFLATHQDLNSQIG